MAGYRSTDFEVVDPAAAAEVGMFEADQGTMPTGQAFYGEAPNGQAPYGEADDGDAAAADASGAAYYGEAYYGGAAAADAGGAGEWAGSAHPWRSGWRGDDWSWYSSGWNHDAS